MEQTSEFIIADFRAGKKKFNRLFWVGLLFALACHFYVVEPYFHFKSQEIVLKESSVELEQSLKDLSKQTRQVRTVKEQAQNGLIEIREQLIDFPKELRDSLPDIHKAVEQANARPEAEEELFNLEYDQDVAQYIEPQRGGIVPLDITNFEDGVSWYINNWFDELLERLENRIVKPVSRLAELKAVSGTIELEEVSKKAVKEVRDNIAGIVPGFWHSYDGPGGKIDVAAQIRGQIKEAFQPVEEQVAQVLSKAEELRQTQEDQLETLEDNLKDTRRGIDSLAERIKTLESPFGRISLGLMDLIKLFPFILVFLAINLVVSLRQTVRLRGIIKKLLVESRKKLPVQLLEYQLGGWLFPPVDRTKPLVLVVAWFATLIFIFSRSAWLIGGDPQLFELPAEMTSMVSRQLYQAGSLAGLLILAGAGWLGLKTLVAA